MLKKCKVIDCQNRELGGLNKKALDETMKNTYGYCQIHQIEGLVQEVRI